jgi:tetratricopeptide (TPR) repeat protein
MADDVMLREAIQALQDGQRARARDLLTRLLRADQGNAAYWLWMSAAVDTAKEQIYCLQTVLRMDPGNASARRGLALLGGLPGEAEVKPSPPLWRAWESPLEAETPRGLKGLLARPGVRIAFIIGVAIIVVGLLLLGVFGLGRRVVRVAQKPTVTPGPPPTFTSTPTYIGGEAAAATPTLPPGPPPLWTLLEATYTPTPMYVRTPHPISEAYRIGERALGRGEYETALRFLRDAAQVEPGAADIQYYLAVSHLALGDPQAALQACEQAIALNEAFAPGYVCRARVNFALGSEAGVLDDLDRALELDARLAEAYLARAAYLLHNGELETAMSDLDAVEEIQPYSVELLLYRAQAAMAGGEADAALEYAREANRRDRTLLPGYLVLGQAALFAGQHAAAQEPLETYTLYAGDDPAGWAALGQAYLRLPGVEPALIALAAPLKPKDLDAAMDAFARAEALDSSNLQLYFFRAMAFLLDGEGQKAVNALVEARRLEPSDFAVNLALGIALARADRSEDGVNQMYASERLADSDGRLALVYYWRARVAQEMGNSRDAQADWQALLELPAEALPPGWAEQAAQRLLEMSTPSATPTATRTPRPSPTPTLTRTPQPSATITPTRTALPATATLTASP